MDYEQFTKMLPKDDDDYSGRLRIVLKYLFEKCERLEEHILRQGMMHAEQTFAQYRVGLEWESKLKHAKENDTIEAKGGDL